MGDGQCPDVPSEEQEMQLSRQAMAKSEIITCEAKSELWEPGNNFKHGSGIVRYMFMDSISLFRCV